MMPAMARLLAGVDADLAACERLAQLLETQFGAALRHRNDQLATLAGSIVAEAGQMEARRRQRVALVGGLAGPAAGMDHLLLLLRAPARHALRLRWAELERRLLACKRLNERNGALLTEQYSTMQRVLLGEEHLYAPA